MFMKQADLLWGLDKNFVKSIMDIGVNKQHEKGSFLFRHRDVADTFYILLKGRVRLSTGQPSKTVHVVSHAGEAFGWSGMVGRETYSSSAECTEAAKFMEFKTEEIVELCKKDPVNGMEFYRRLAGVLGRRLIVGYSFQDTMSHDEMAPTYGSGQILRSDATT